MATIHRYTALWTAGSGGAGTTTFHMGASSAAAGAGVPAFRAFFDAVKSNLPPDVTITFPSTVDLVDEATGTLVGSIGSSPVASVTGIGSGVYSAPTGGRVRWLTNEIVGGRRVRGTTFIVPMTGASYSADGTLSAAAVTVLGNAATALLATTSLDLAVYHRPTSASPTSGQAVLCTGSFIPEQAAILRSRRD